MFLQVATLDWLEKKAAAALYQSPPSSTLHDALEYFLKVHSHRPRQYLQPFILALVLQGKCNYRWKRDNTNQTKLHPKLEIWLQGAFQFSFLTGNFGNLAAVIFSSVNRKHCIALDRFIHLTSTFYRGQIDVRSSNGVQQVPSWNQTRNMVVWVLYKALSTPGSSLFIFY